MKVFEDDQLMAYKPREKALLSHREFYILVKLFTKAGAEKMGDLGKLTFLRPNFLIFEVNDCNTYLIDLV